jgi:hypothetical protein
MGDGDNAAAAQLASSTLAHNKLPASLSVDDAARLLTLVATHGSQHVPPLAELIIRAHGLPAAIETAARMWALKSHRDPKAGTFIRAIEDDDDTVHDTSCSYGKSELACYLAQRFTSGTAAERAEMKQAVTAIWKTTMPHARPALAYATRDPQRAKESALELIDAGESPWPYWAWAHLPYVLTDAELVLRIIGDRQLSVALIDNLGTAIWPLYEERIASHIDARMRAGLLRDFSNFYGPKTALLIAEYEDTKESAPVVRDYFTLYPELLDRVIDEPALKYHREDLEKLRVDASRRDTPGPGRPRS